MRVAVYTLFILIVLATGTAIYAATKRAAVIRGITQSTVVVHAISEKEGSQGSGTVIGARAGYVFVLTCHHVIDGATEITIAQTNHTDKWINASIEVDDPDLDLTLLVAKANYPVLPIATIYPEVYDTVYLYGAPQGEMGTASEGMITDLHNVYRDRVFWRVTNAFVAPGISGGTATNIDGQLIGVPALGSRYTTQMGLLITLTDINTVVRGYVGH